MRTRCLECEMSTYRSETFTNIDVPLHLEEPEDVDELSGPDLFLKQILMSETLRENNKYWCEECGRLNEAQRSVQYELLPRVMVLQLKRFTTATGGPKSYSVSKINDYIPTPFTMNCFCTQCMSPPSSKSSGRGGGHQPKGDSKHLYKLYAVIMHLGATLASGHYIAYVRASSQDSAAMEYAQCQRGGVSASETRENGGSVSAKHQNGTMTKGPSAATATDRPAKNKKPGIMKFLRRGGEKSNSSLSSSSSPALFNASSTTNPNSATNGDCVDSSDAASLASFSTPPCQGASCCGIRAPLQPSSSDQHHSKRHHQHVTNGVSNGVSHSHQSNGAVVHQRSLDSTDSSYLGSADGSVTGSSHSSPASEVWLECDDESIQVISRKQFEAILSAKQGATTPYLLFYQRLE